MFALTTRAKAKCMLKDYEVSRISSAVSMCHSAQLLCRFAAESLLCGCAWQRVMSLSNRPLHTCSWRDYW